VSDAAEGSARYYLRFTVEDHPGVLAQITGVLGKHSISIASVIQHEPGEADGSIFVPLVIMTHSTTAGATRAALDEIGGLGCVRQGSVSLRVLH
jgi:homoserine dehydrogenase